MSTRLETAYISARLAGSDRIHEFRDTLFDSLKMDDTEYTRRSAHITIIPSFHVTRDAFHDINQALADIDLAGTTVQIRGLGVYPNIRNPRAVLLDADVDLSGERQYLLDILDQVGATNITEPVPPHITLFKCDNGYVLEDWQKKQLQDTILDNRIKWSTEINYVDLVPTTHHD